MLWPTNNTISVNGSGRQESEFVSKGVICNFLKHRRQ